MRVVGIMSRIGGRARCDGCRGVMGVTTEKSKQATQGGKGKAGSWCGHLGCVKHE